MSFHHRRMPASGTLPREQGEIPLAAVPVITIRARDAEAAEVPAGGAANPGGFQLTRTGDLTQPLTVSYLIEGTATNGQDYKALKATVTFKAGSAKAKITLSVRDDTGFEGDETVTLRLLDGAGYDLGGAKAATVVIRDNDAPPPRQPGLALVEQFGGSGNDAGQAIAVGPDGRVHVVGTSQTVWNNRVLDPSDLGRHDGTIDGWYGRFDGTTGDQFGDFQRFARPIEGPIFQGRNIYYGYTNDIMTGVTVDGAGNSITVGTLVYRGLIAHGNDPSTPDDNTTRPIENNDIVIAKFGADGRVIWSKVIHQTLDDQAHDVTTDATGNIYVAGSMNQDEYGRPTPYGALLMKFAPDGTLLWSKGVGDNLADAQHVTIAADGSVLVAGHYWEHDWTRPGLENAFVAKYSPDGTPVWVQPLVMTNGNDRITGFDTDGAGNAYASGFSLRYDAMNNAVETHWIAQMSDDGIAAWTKVESSPLHAYSDLEVGADGFLYVAGKAQQGSTLLQGFVRKIDPMRIQDPDGGLVWETRLGDADNPAVVLDLEFGPGGAIWVTGAADGAVWGAERGGADAFFARLDATGAVTATGGAAGAGLAWSTTAGAGLAWSPAAGADLAWSPAGGADLAWSPAAASEDQGGWIAG